jgi:hypothetical protein
MAKRALANWVKAAGPIFDRSAAYEMLSFMRPGGVEGAGAALQVSAPVFRQLRSAETGLKSGKFLVRSPSGSRRTSEPTRRAAEAGTETRAATSRPGCSASSTVAFTCRRRAMSAGTTLGRAAVIRPSPLTGVGSSGVVSQAGHRGNGGCTQ